MIILDTNVLSELMKQRPNERVVQWIDSQPKAGLFTTTVTQAEIFYGVSVLPAGKRKDDLVSAVEAVFEHDFKLRVLPFDSPAAAAFATICTDRLRLGRPISQFDAQIAGIAQSRGSALATRNTSDFGECGVRVVDPWQE